MAVFQPSKASLSPRKKALLALGYSKAAITKLEVFLLAADDGEVPVWFFTRINQAATSFGQAVSFVQFREQKNKEDKKS